MAGEITIDLWDGRRITVDEVVVLERENGEWLRCVRNESSRRMGFPETTTYYHLARDVDRIFVSEERSSNEVPPRRIVLRSMTTGSGRTRERSNERNERDEQTGWCVLE
jgi:hypothetical protein